MINVAIGRDSAFCRTKTIELKSESKVLVFQYPYSWDSSYCSIVKEENWTYKLPNVQTFWIKGKRWKKSTICLIG